MIFITDGDYDCPQDDDDEYTLANEDFLAIVEESGVRIITIAFRWGSHYRVECLLHHRGQKSCSLISPAVMTQTPIWRT